MLLSPLRFLPLEPAQLSLAAVLRNGQCFLWKNGRARATVVAKELDGKGKESELTEWSYGHVDRTIVLRQDASGLHYRSLFPAKHAAAHAEDAEKDTTLAFLRKYFVLDVSLPPLYSFWSKKDRNFALKTANGTRYGGIRILRQPTWECLVEFICSSNNNISRIEGMLKRLCRLYGERLPSAALLDPGQPVTTEEEADQIYAFPRPSELIGDRVTSALRAAGFGYRDAYVTKTAALVCELGEQAGFKESPEEYLETLASLPETEAKEALLQFAGVGPKVADCILLFGLGFADVVPVDTHVYQIAVRDYGLKGSRDAAVSKVMYQKVREKLQAVWGEKPGWAHQILFTADLAAFADFVDPLLVVTTSTAIKAEDETSLSEVIVKEEKKEIEALLEPPLPAKRKRIATVKVEASITSTFKSRKSRSISLKKSTVRETTLVADAALAYPTPPHTPSLAKVEGSLEPETPLSLAERVKRRRTSRA